MLVKSANNNVGTRIAARIISPPMVGVPAFCICPSNPKSRMVSPTCFLRSIRINVFPNTMEIVNEISEEMTSISDYLYLANVLIALQEKLYFKLKQIDKTEYTWLSPKIVAQCNSRLENTIGKECNNKKPKIEKLIIQQKDEDAHEEIDEFLSSAMETNAKFRFTARVDLVTEDTVWENKCTTTLTIDHKLQLVIYAWLWKMTHREDDKEKPEKKYKLFNIKTGEVLVLDATTEQLNYIMVELLKGKYFVQEKKTDTEFIEDCMEKML